MDQRAKPEGLDFPHTCCKSQVLQEEQVLFPVSLLTIPLLGKETLCFRFHFDQQGAVVGVLEARDILGEVLVVFWAS